MICTCLQTITMFSHLNSNYESEFSEIKIDNFLISKLLAVFFIKTNIKKPTICNNRNSHQLKAHNENHIHIFVNE